MTRSYRIDPNVAHRRAKQGRAAQSTPAYHAVKLAEAVEPLTDEQVAELRAQVAKSRARQGLPPTVQDPAAVEKVASIFRAAAPHDTEGAA